MTHHFTLPDFPGNTFSLEISVWTGKAKLLMDNTALERSKEKGKPFLIPRGDGVVVKAFPRQRFPDMVGVLEIDGKKYDTVKKLQWYEITIGSIPFLLVAGGAIGGGIGAAAAMVNYSILRGETSASSKYLKIAGVCVLAFLAYALIAGGLVMWLKK
jgi:hypothetical protein